MCMLLLSNAQSCLALCDPMDCGLPGSFVHGIFYARILEWLSCPPSRDLPDPGIEPVSLSFPVSPAFQVHSTTELSGSPLRCIIYT